MAVRYFSGSREAGKDSVASQIKRIEIQKKGKFSSTDRYQRMLKTTQQMKRMNEMRGEKESGSGHYWMDFLEGSRVGITGNDITEIEQTRHSARSRNSGGGGSVYGFADGSVHYLRFGRSLAPINLWAVTPLWRTNAF